MQGESLVNHERKPTVSAVVPVYNSANSLTELVERLSKVLEEHSSAFEIIFVNDGSRDNRWDVVVSLADRYPFLRALNLSRNYDQHNALLAGIRAARYELIVTLDDDLQNPFEEIPKLIEELRWSGSDVVYGVPKEEEHGLGRDLALQFNSFRRFRLTHSQVRVYHV